MSRVSKYLIVAALGAIMLLYAVAASADTVCGDRWELYDYLSEEYGEQFHTAVQNSTVPGGVIVLWISKDTGTYSLMFFPDEHTACMFDSGQSDRFISEGV